MVQYLRGKFIHLERILFVVRTIFSLAGREEMGRMDHHQFQWLDKLRIVGYMCSWKHTSMFLQHMEFHHRQRNNRRHHRGRRHHRDRRSSGDDGGIRNYDGSDYDIHSHGDGDGGSHNRFHCCLRH